ncbi:hypothetical protein [Streptomyces sp. NPDC085540]|uniref:hypothetical protein n=1 Tax=Streptomyces sp. NPDC085540 TaxID=3365730 RepID=UPI0037D535D3
MRTPPGGQPGSTTRGSGRQEPGAPVPSGTTARQRARGADGRAPTGSRREHGKHPGRYDDNG